MNGYDGTTGKIGGMAQDDMGTLLALHDEPAFLESSDEAGARDLRKHAHAVTSTSVRMTSSAGMGSLSSRRLQRYSWMASRMLAKASCSVSPWLAQPVRLGTYTEKPPRGSCSKMTLYRRVVIALISVLDGRRRVKPAKSLCRIVERNKGRISVESTVGKGTTFFLDFPAVKTATVAV